jgi:hypothetical protein
MRRNGRWPNFECPGRKAINRSKTTAAAKAAVVHLCGCAEPGATGVVRKGLRPKAGKDVRGAANRTNRASRVYEWCGLCDAAMRRKFGAAGAADQDKSCDPVLNFPAVARFCGVP